MTAMTAIAKGKSSVGSVEAVLGQRSELFKRLLEESLQEVLDAEMTEVVGAGPGERTAERSGYRSGCNSRSLVTRIGKRALRVPRDRHGSFSTELFERYQRSAKALVSALAEIAVQGVSATPTTCAYPILGQLPAKDVQPAPVMQLPERPADPKVPDGAAGREGGD